jgi:tetratricopeptide (TPR) repeat protein
MSGSSDYGAVREDAIAEARERVHTLASQGLTAAEIERRLGSKLTATEWELLRDIARREVESAHMSEQELEAAPAPPKRSARDLALSAARAWGYKRRTRPALATALLVLSAAGAGVVIGSLLASSKPTARHHVEASATRRPKHTPEGQRSALANVARPPVPRPRARQSAPRPVGGGQPGPQAEPNRQVDVARAAHLNDDGFQLMNAGRYNEAIPPLRRAVAAFPHQSTDLTYAYALYNLGRSLRLAGRPNQAIPLLERRLQIDNQREKVARELAAARRSDRTTR